MSEQTWFELVKVLGLPATGFLFVLWTGYRQVWHWHREIEARDATITELREAVEYWRDQRMNTLTELEKRVAERDFRTWARDREARE